MTSTFPTSRSNSHNLRYSIKQLQHKKEALINLEAALKRRINEFRELCLKEGELTGHLPADYPLQPREPIPQVRRRITRSNGNIPNELQASSSSISSSSIMPPPTSSVRIPGQKHPVNFALPTTNSNFKHPMSSRSSIADNRQQQTDILGHGMHSRSHSESVTNGLPPGGLLTSDGLQQLRNRYNSDGKKDPVPKVHSDSYQKPFSLSSNQHNMRTAADKTQTQLIEKQGSESNINGLYVNGNLTKREHIAKTSFEGLNNLNQLNGDLKNFQPYYEETKPFQMSDFYKYSAKHRQKVPGQPGQIESIDKVTSDSKTKTTRQLQDEIATMKNPNKFSECDDFIRAAHKRIEQSDQKLMRATAKAIASNPSLAEKLHNIHPSNNNNGGKY